MSRADEQKELEALLQRIADEAIEPCAGERLEQLLTGDPVRQRFYFDYLAAHVGLENEGRLRAKTAALAAAGQSVASRGGDVLKSDPSVAASVFAVSAIEEGRSAAFLATQRAMQSRWISLAIAASVLLSIGIGVVRVGGFSRGTVRFDPESPATVVAVSSVEWGSALRLAAGETLRTEEKYELLAGAVELRMGSGAQIVLEAPVTWRLAGSNEFKLLNGAVAARVPRSAIGFVVESGSCRVVDLGTEFGVRQTASGDTQVRVFDGLVRVEAGRRKARVAAGNAVVVDPAGEVRQEKANQIAFLRPTAFGRQQRELSGATELAERSDLLSSPDLLLWCDMAPGASGKVVTNLAPAGPPHLTLTHSDPGAAFVADRFGGRTAVEFVEPGDHIALDIPGDFDQITLAAWVRFDTSPDTPTARWRGLLMSENWDALGQLHWGRKGRGLYASYPVDAGQSGRSSTPMTLASFNGMLTPGWRFVVTVIDNRRGQAAHFIDGELIEAFGTPKSAPRLRLDRCAIGGRSMEQRSAERDAVLGGRVDELFVWSRALNQGEVAELYRVTRSRDAKRGAG